MTTRAGSSAGAAAAAGEERSGPSPVTVALLLSAVHGFTDAYVAFLPPLLPRMMDRLGLSVALAATLATVLYVASALPQPVLGHLADRHGRRLFVVGGPLLTAVSLSLIGVVPGLTLLLLLLVLGGAGSAAFHPPAAVLAARTPEGGRAGLRYSFFSVGGTLGFAAGPLVAVGVAGTVGIERLWLAMVPGVLCAMLLLGVVPPGGGDGDSETPDVPSFARRLLGPLGLIFGVSAASAFVHRVYLTMMPIVAAEAGASETTGAVMLSTYLAAQAGGSLVGGWLTDRMSRRVLVVALTLFAVPAHLGAFWLAPGSAGALALAAAAGFLNLAILPPLVVSAQELFPRNAAASSGVAMGLAWAAGSFGVLGTGVLGDLLGARPASMLSVPVLLLGTLLALHPVLEGPRSGRGAGAVGNPGAGPV